MKRSVLLCLALVASAGLLFAGGAQEAQGQDSDGVTTIRWAYWGSGTRVEISQEAIDLYEERNPNVRVNPEVSGGAGDHFIKADTQIAGGAGPDILQMGGNINDYVNRDVLLPLDEYAGTILNTEVIDDSAIQSGTIDGNLYGVSTGVTMPALVYNKSLLEREGIALPDTSMTYDEFRDYLVMLRDNLPDDVYPMMDIGAMSSNSTPFGYWSRYNGTPLYDAENNTTPVTPEAATRYLELFEDYRENGLIPPADVASGYAETNADSSAIVAGRVAIGYLFTNQLSGYQAAMTDEIDLIEFPGAVESNALWVAPSQFYTINKNSQNVEEAVRFINFLVNDPDAALILGNNRGASASATARAAGATSEADQKVLDYLETAAPHTSPDTPRVPNDTELNSTLYLIYQQVAFGQLTPEEGGQEIYDLLTRLIES
jgi:multiple sugar transport system substrate-binding protein